MNNRIIFSFLLPYRWWFFWGMFVLLLSSLLGVLLPVLLGHFFGAKDIQAVDWKNISLQNVHFLFFCLLSVFALQAFLSFWRIFLFAKVTENALADLRAKVFGHFLHLPLPFYFQNKVGELNSHFVSDIQLLQETFTTTFAELIRQIFVVVGSFCFLFFLSLKLTFLMLFTLPLMSVLAVFFGKKIKKLAQKNQENIAISNQIVEESLRGILVVKSFSQEVFEYLRYGKINQSVKNEAIKNAFFRGIFVSFIIFCMLGSIILMIWYGLWMKEKGELTEAQFFSFLFSSVFIGISIGSLPELYAKIQKAVGSTSRIVQWLSLEIEKLDQEKELILSDEISFENVSFSYPSRKEIAVLKDLSFTLSAGKTTALVGSSGAGKSTVVQMLFQMLLPDQGFLSRSGYKADQIPLKNWRKEMVLVPQEVFLFGGTIADNILYGRPDASEKEVLEAVEKANMMEFIQKFPEGLQTLVGDRGIQLSGGQKQRVAIARALLKNSKILILDEATSALDNESEALVQDALENLMKNRTCLVIAHRLSTIKNADQILVLHQGKIVEAGKHQELMEKNGFYAHLYHHK